MGRLLVVIVFTAVMSGMPVHTAFAQTEEGIYEGNPDIFEEEGFVTIEGTLTKLSLDEGIMVVDDKTIKITPDDYDYISCEIGDKVRIVAEKTTDGLIFYDYTYLDSTEKETEDEEKIEDQNKDEEIPGQLDIKEDDTREQDEQPFKDWDEYEEEPPETEEEELDTAE